jgi:hypothetical protein
MGVVPEQRLACFPKILTALGSGRSSGIDTQFNPAFAGFECGFRALGARFRPTRLREEPAVILLALAVRRSARQETRFQASPAV